MMKNLGHHRRLLRRIVRFRLRTILIAFVAFSLVMTYWIWEFNRRSQYIGEMKQKGVHFSFSQSATQSLSRRIMALLSDDVACFDVDEVLFSGWIVDDSQGTFGPVRYNREPIDYSALANLREIRELSLISIDVCDEDLADISRLRNLEILRLDNSLVSDQGIKHLAVMKSLQFVSLAGTKVTSTGFETLRDALPQCKVRTVRPVAQMEIMPE